jgi:iron complex transport system substrate-binding protein
MAFGGENPLALPFFMGSQSFNFLRDYPFFVKTLSFLFFSLLCLTGCRPQSPATDSTLRIISLAPNITEIIYALHLEDSLVGVSRFCDYPKAAKQKQSVGGLYDINVEEIYSLHPTVVFFLPSQMVQANRLRSLGIQTVCVANGSLLEVDQAILTIGSHCHRSSQAAELVKSLHSLLPPVVGHTGIRGLVVVSRGWSSDMVFTLYVAGQGSWYEKVLAHFGAENAYQGALAYPQVGVEGILKMKPDFVIELVVNAKELGYTPEVQRMAWQFLLSTSPRLKLFIVSDQYSVRPGPRYPLLFNRFHKIISQVVHER